MATDRRHRCRSVLLLLLFLLCFHHTLVTGCVFWCVCVFLHAFFGALVCVWNVFFPK